jgi:hypothetical protein
MARGWSKVNPVKSSAGACVNLGAKAQQCHHHGQTASSDEGGARQNATHTGFEGSRGVEQNPSQGAAQRLEREREREWREQGGIRGEIAMGAARSGRNPSREFGRELGRSGAWTREGSRTRKFQQAEGHRGHG